jgi:hypothetical protein
MKSLIHRLSPFAGHRLAGFAFAVAAMSLSTGCLSMLVRKDHKSNAVAYAPANHAGDKIMPPGLHRIVLLPIAGGSVASAESTSLIDPLVAAVLQQQNRFEVVQMTRDECRTHFHIDEVSSVSALPSNFLSVIRSEYNADAVMFVDVTVYSAYQPVAIGLRAKLAMIGDARLIWTFDNVFSSDDPAVAATAVRFLQGREQAGIPSGDLTPVMLESPTRFANYAAAAMFATLPPIKAPESLPKAKREAAIKR